jgi:hypothetical protein
LKRFLNKLLMTVLATFSTFALASFESTVAPTAEQLRTMSPKFVARLSDSVTHYTTIDGQLFFVHDSAGKIAASYQNGRITKIRITSFDLDKDEFVTEYRQEFGVPVTQKQRISDYTKSRTKDIVAVLQALPYPIADLSDEQVSMSLKAVGLQSLKVQAKSSLCSGSSGLLLPSATLDLDLGCTDLAPKPIGCEAEQLFCDMHKEMCFIAAEETFDKLMGGCTAISTVPFADGGTGACQAAAGTKKANEKRKCTRDWFDCRFRNRCNN